MSTNSCSMDNSQSRGFLIKSPFRSPSTTDGTTTSITIHKLETTFKVHQTPRASAKSKKVGTDEGRKYKQRCRAQEHKKQESQASFSTPLPSVNTVRAASTALKLHLTTKERNTEETLSSESSSCALQKEISVLTSELKKEVSPTPLFPPLESNSEKKEIGCTEFNSSLVSSCKLSTELPALEMDEDLLLLLSGGSISSKCDVSVSQSNTKTCSSDLASVYLFEAKPIHSELVQSMLNRTECADELISIFASYYEQMSKNYLGKQILLTFKLYLDSAESHPRIFVKTFENSNNSIGKISNEDIYLHIETSRIDALCTNIVNQSNLFSLLSLYVYQLIFNNNGFPWSSSEPREHMSQVAIHACVCNIGKFFFKDSTDEELKKLDVFQLGKILYSHSIECETGDQYFDYALASLLNCFSLDWEYIHKYFAAVYAAITTTCLPLCSDKNKELINTLLKPYDLFHRLLQNSVSEKLLLSQ